MSVSLRVWLSVCLYICMYEFVYLSVGNYFTYLVLGRLCVPNDLPNKVVESEVPLTGLSSTGP